MIPNPLPEKFHVYAYLLQDTDVKEKYILGFDLPRKLIEPFIKSYEGIPDEYAIHALLDMLYIKLMFAHPYAFDWLADAIKDWPWYTRLIAGDRVYIRELNKCYEMGVFGWKEYKAHEV